MMIIATIYTMDATKQIHLLVLSTLLVKTSLLAAKMESLPFVYLPEYSIWTTLEK
jgi:hypothetical protein